MFIVPAETPGVEIIRNVGVGTESEDTATHAYMRYHDVRVPADHILGAEGAAFDIAQARLGGGRIHHAMRTIAQIRRTFDMMLERAASRHVRSGTLGAQQLTQEKIADTWIEMEQFRLLVLRTAWLIDKHQDYSLVRKDISAVKAAMPKVYYNAVTRAMHLHGSLGISNEMPFSHLLVEAEVMALADGPTEIHQMTLAKELLKTATPHPGLFPTEHIPTRRAAAQAKLAQHLEHAAATH
jgi:acyl-CoA dehydrogenase